MDLAPYIRELVLLNECVILPEFGGFETEYAPAKYDNHLKRMLPPTKKVRFRADFTKGGDVLRDHLCKRLRISESEAQKVIKDYVTELTNRIELQREVIIEGVGLFTKGLGSTLNFSAFEDENYLVESYGLDSLEYSHHGLAPDQEKQVAELKIRPRNNTLILVLVGLGVIFLLLSITIFISSRFDLYLFNLGDIRASDEILVLGNQDVSDTIKAKIDNQLIQSTDIRTALQYSEQPIEKLALEQSIYYLIAGSFKSLRNAESLEKELARDGFEPIVIQNGGYYRVTIGNFSDKSDALLELKRLRRQLNRSVWLLSV